MKHMKQIMIRTVVSWAGLTFAAAAVPSAAMDATAGLGAGLHAFHGGQYAESFEWLSGVIEAGSKDPRAFYFRGLAARRCGREFEAEADFLEGARLEAMGSAGLNIGRALERVQGADRMLIERYRAKARAAVAADGRETARRRYTDAAPEPDESVFRRRRPEAEGDAPGKTVKPMRESAPALLPAQDAEEDAEEEAEEEEEEAEEPRDGEPSTKDEAEEPAVEAPAKAKPDPFGDPFGDEPLGAGEGEPAERKAAAAKAADDAADAQAEREAAGGAASAIDDFK